MTQEQLHEIIKEHHPEMSETEIRLRLNKAMKEFCRKSKILKGVFLFNTTIDKRYYGLDPKIIEVNSVDYNGETIKRLLSKPSKKDLDND